MPLIAYFHAPTSPGRGRPPWEPDWRVWRPGAMALLATAAATELGGVAGLALILLALALACRAVDAALPYRDGLREHHQ